MARARCLAALGRLGAELGEHDLAIKHLGESVDIYQSLGEQQELAASFNDLAAVHRLQGNYDIATSLDSQALPIQRKLRHTRGIGTSLNGLAMDATVHGDYARATDLFTESAAAIKQTGDLQATAQSLSNAGALASRLGDLERSTRLTEEALVIRRRLRDPQAIAISLFNLATNEIETGQPLAALPLLDEAEDLLLDTSDVLILGAVLHAGGCVHAQLSDLPRAARHFRSALDYLEIANNPETLIESFETFRPWQSMQRFGHGVRHSSRPRKRSERTTGSNVTRPLAAKKNDASNG